jgi:hypothetical protein
MGLWLSEGSLNQGFSRKGRGNGYRHYNIWIWQKKNELCITKLLERMPIKFKRYENAIGWCGSNKEIFNYLKQFGKSGDKFIPQEIKDSSIENIKLFLKWYEFGDGTKKNGKCILVTTKSKRMAEDLQELYIKSGISARINLRNDGCYEVRKHTNYNIGLKQRFLKIEEVKDEEVFCVMVPNHTVLVKRNDGRPIFCGNCLVTQIDNFDRWVWLNEFLGRDTTIDKFADYITEKLNSLYPGAKIRSYGDPAGNQSNDKSEKTSSEILTAKGFPIISRQSTYRERKEIIEGKLAKLNGNKPALLIDRKCKICIDGFLGGYHYPTKKEQQQYEDKFEVPYKDGFYDHLMNSGEYIAVNIFKPFQRQDFKERQPNYAYRKSFVTGAARQPKHRRFAR